MTRTDSDPTVPRRQRWMADAAASEITSVAAIVAAAVVVYAIAASM